MLADVKAHAATAKPKASRSVETRSSQGSASLLATCSPKATGGRRSWMSQCQAGQRCRSSSNPAPLHAAEKGWHGQEPVQQVDHRAIRHCEGRRCRRRNGIVCSCVGHRDAHPLCFVRQHRQARCVRQRSDCVAIGLRRDRARCNRRPLRQLQEKRAAMTAAPRVMDA